MTSRKFTPAGVFGRRGALVALALFGMVLAVLLSIATRLTPHVRDAATSALDERFQSDVELDALQVSVFPRPEVSGAGLRLRHNGRTDVPPLIAIGSYSASAGLLGLFSSPLRLRTVELDRLEITIPPGGLRDKRREERPRQNGAGEGPGISIERIVSREARLEIVPRDRAKLPRVFEIHDLVMVGLGDAGGARFNASLTNPKPRGRSRLTARSDPGRRPSLEPHPYVATTSSRTQTSIPSRALPASSRRRAAIPACSNASTSRGKRTRRISRLTLRVSQCP